MAYEIHIDGFIGSPDWWMDSGDSFSVKNLQDKLAAMPSDTKEIDVIINSGGGYVTEGFAIHDLLSTQDVKVNTIALGICGSIATIIAQSPKSQNKGGVRKGYQNSDYFIHNPSWTPQSADPLEAADLHKIADDLLANQNKLANFYAAISGKENTFFLDKMKEAKSLPMSEAKDYGLIDEVITTNIQAATIYKFAAHISKQQTAMNKIETFLTEKFAAFKNEIAAIVKPSVKNATTKTSEGVDIFYDGELQVGTKVYTNVEMTAPAPDGVHTVGEKLYTVANGEVTKVEDATMDKTEAEIANEKIASLEAQLAAKDSEVTAAVAAKEVELTAKFEEKFTAFKGTFFTGEKLNPAFEQIIKSDNAPAPAKSWKDEVIALRTKK